MTVTYLCFPFVPCRNNTDRISLLIIRRKSSSDVFCSEAFFNMCATVDMQTLKILRKKIQLHAAHCDVIREMTSPPWPCVCSCPVFVRACVTDSAVSLAEARCLHVMNIHNKSQNLSINVSTNRGSWASGLRFPITMLVRSFSRWILQAIVNFFGALRTRVHCTHDVRRIVTVYWHGAEMGSVGGGDAGMMQENGVKKR